MSKKRAHSISETIPALFYRASKISKSSTSSKYVTFDVSLYGDQLGLLNSRTSVLRTPRAYKGDETGSLTIIQAWQSKKRVCKSHKPVCNTLNKMTLLDVSKSLTSFDSSWEYVNAIGDAIEAHWFAYKNARILHRDISVGNIIIAADGMSGFLIDWDLCKRLPPLDGMSGTLVRKNSKPIFQERTGTWQFIAAMSMIDPKHEHNLQDDLESFLWVLSWVSLRYTKHNQTPSTLSVILAAFDEIFYDAETSGGLSKRSFLLGNRIPNDVDFLGRAALNQLVAKLTKLFATRYAEPFNKEALERYHRLRNRDEEYVLDNPIYLHAENLKRLQTSAYVLDNIRAVTAVRDAWPRNDNPVPQDVDPGFV